jgi:hypothetical protein
VLSAVARAGWRTWPGVVESGRGMSPGSDCRVCPSNLAAGHSKRRRRLPSRGANRAKFAWVRFLLTPSEFSLRRSRFAAAADASLPPPPSPLFGFCPALLLSGLRAVLPLALHSNESSRCRRPAVALPHSVNCAAAASPSGLFAFRILSLADSLRLSLSRSVSCAKNQLRQRQRTHRRHHRTEVGQLRRSVCKRSHTHHSRAAVKPLTLERRRRWRACVCVRFFMANSKLVSSSRLERDPKYDDHNHRRHEHFNLELLVPVRVSPNRTPARTTKTARVHVCPPCPSVQGPEKVKHL